MARAFGRAAVGDHDILHTAANRHLERSPTKGAADVNAAVSIDICERLAKGLPEGRRPRRSALLSCRTRRERATRGVLVGLGRRL